MDRSWVDRLADDLAASRAELAGLGLLLVGGIVVAVLALAGSPTATVEGAPTSPSAEDGVVASPSPRAPTTPAPSATAVVVHVTGAVRRPDVVALPVGSRLVDAVEAAGGPRSGAALEALNLAQVLTDGQRLHVPTRREVEQAGERTGPPGGPDVGTTGAGSSPLDPGTGLAPTTPRTPAPTTGGGPIDLNLATSGDLEDLPGVGPVLAGRILAWRDEHGGFDDVGQLRDVAGIGEVTFQELAPLVEVP